MPHRTQAIRKRLSPFPASEEDPDTNIYHYMLDHIGDEVSLVAEDGRIVYANEAAADALGYSFQYIRTKDVTHFLRPKISLNEWKRTYLQELKSSKVPLTYQVKRRVKGGKEQILEARAVYLSINGRGYILSAARNVTDKMQMQKSLAQSEALYRLLAEAAGDAIVSLDLSGRIFYANESASRILQMPRSSIIGRHFKTFVVKDSELKAWEYFRKVQTEGAQYNVELNIRDANKRIIPVEVTGAPLKKEEKIFAVHIIVRDIRQRLAYERLLKETERIKAIQFFVSGTSQELQHPLQGVSQKVQDLLNQYKNRDYEYIGYKEYLGIMQTLEDIKKQVRYCSETTERIVKLNRKKIGIRTSLCSLNLVVKNVLRQQKQRLKDKKINTMVHLKKGLSPVRLSEIDVTQVVTNIVNNSLQAMPGGGTLTIRTSEPRAEGRVRLDICDDGIGIPKENLRNVFEPFFTTKQRGIDKNSGMGLAIVDAVVRSAGGSIEIDSNLRKGTALRIWLPAEKGR